MSHLRLYQEGKISRTEYETLSNLKRSGQRGLYRLYEKSLKKSAREREEGRRRSERRP